MFDITTLSDDLLCEAGRRLQEAHDYIEAKGFDIMTYGSEGRACCYIGTVKTVGDECPWPLDDSELVFSDTSAAVMRLLDSVVDVKWHDVAKRDKRFDYPGRAVELFGLLGQPLKDVNELEQAQIALPIYRQAIRKVQSEMDRRRPDG